MDTVFVYGTLKQGFGNHRLLRNSKFLGKAETQPIFTMISLGAFPAVLVDGDVAIKGEVYEVDENTMQQLDWLEGHPNFYRRIQVSTTLGPAWMYTIPSDRSREHSRIPSGFWDGYKGEYHVR